MTRSRWVVDVRALLTDGAADDLDELRDELAIAAAAVPTQYRAEPETQDERERRDRVMSAAERNYWQSRRGQVERLPFSGPVAALRALDCVRLDGPPLRTCWRVGEDSSGCVQTQPEGDAGQRDVERVAFVGRAFDALFADGWVVQVSPVLRALSPTQARAVLAWSVLGLPRVVAPNFARDTERTRTADANRRPSKERLASRRPRARWDDGDWDAEPAEIAAHAWEEFGVAVSAGDVISIRVSGLAAMYVTLYESGQVPASREWEAASMTDERAWDAEGWTEIAGEVGRGVRLCQELAEREQHPLPVRKVMGRIVARKSEIRGWLAAEFERAAK